MAYQHPTQLNTLATKQLAALTRVQVAEITASQIVSLNSTQIAALGANISALNGAVVHQLSPAQLATLPMVQLGYLTSAQIGYLSAEQIDALSPAQIVAMGTDIRGLNSTAIQSLDVAQLAALAEAQVGALTAAQIDSLSPAQIAALGTNIRGLNSGSVQSLDSQQLVALSEDQVGALTTAQVSHLTAAHIDALSPAQIAALSTDIRGLSNAAMQSLDAQQLAKLTVAQLAELKDYQLGWLTTTQIDALTPLQIAALGADIRGMNSRSVRSLGTQQLAALTEDQVEALTTAQVSYLTAAQIDALTPVQIAALGTDIKALDSTAVQSLNAMQLANLTDEQVGALTAAQVGYLSAEQVDTLSPTQIAALGSDIRGLNKAAMLSLDAQQLEKLTIAQIPELKHYQLGWLTSTQIDAMSPTQIAAFGTRLSNLSNDALASLDTAQIDVLASGTLASLSTNQLAILAGRSNPMTEQGTNKLGDNLISGIEAATSTTFRVKLAGTIAGDQVELLLGGASFSTVKKSTLTASDITNGYTDFTVLKTDLGADGSKTLTSRITDVAGNVGTASAALNFTLDTTPPSAPTLAEQGTTDLSDSLMSASEAVMTNFRVTLPTTGSKAVAGNQVELLLDGASFGTAKKSTLTASNIANGYTDFTVLKADLGADGSKALTSRLTDLAGNVGTASAALNFTLDAEEAVYGFDQFLDKLRAFESGINPDLLDTYKAKYSDPSALSYTAMTEVNGIRYPIFDASGNRVAKSMSYSDYFNALNVGNLFDPATATTETVRKMQFASTNDLNFIGYQVGEAALIQAGYYSPPIDPATGLTKYYIWTDTQWNSGELERRVTLPWGTEIILTRVNTWSGSFTGKNGINSLADLRTEAGGQIVIQDVWKANYEAITKQLLSAGKTWSEVLNQSAFTEVIDGVSTTVTLSMSGVIASSHLVGAEATANLLINREIVRDENGTSPLRYIHSFGGLAVPWGTNGNDVLVGNDYTNTFVTAGGADVLTLGKGTDTVLADTSTNRITISDYAVDADQILLTGFDVASRSGLSISSRGNGTYITFADGKIIDLRNVAYSNTITLSDLHIYFQDIYQLSWNGSIETNSIISDFEVGVDRFMAPSGGGYSDLEISTSATDWAWMAQTHSQDYIPEQYTKIAISGVANGYYVTGLSTQQAADSLATITEGFSGMPNDAKLSPALKIDLGGAYGATLSGTSASEAFQHLGNQGKTASEKEWGGAAIYGNGGNDTFKFDSNKISWYGNKELTIGDFCLGGSRAENDILDLSDLKQTAFSLLANKATDGSTDILIKRISDTSMQTIVHLKGVLFDSYESLAIKGGTDQVIFA